MDAHGTVLDRLSSADGVMTMADRDYGTVFASLFGAWLERWPQAVILASGMIGSRQGWREAPYVPCPASFEDLARGIAVVPLDAGRALGLVPGLVSRAGGAAPDVIRGEEAQVFGALKLGGREDGVFVLPGTHSKWVSVAQGRIMGFHSFMTGEVYGLLKTHSILGRLMPQNGEPPFARPAFAAGCALALDDAGGALLHRLFSVRTQGLFARFSPEELPSYLSGLLIGEEIREAIWLLGTRPALPVQLICRPDLAIPYQLALSQAGLESAVIEDAAFAGLFEIARRNALLA
jgi:2-dehydro-3-deoxygalactonokinase